jgi:hypothetical protein
MAVSSIGKAAFDQVLTPSEILSGCFGVGNFASSIEQFLISMPVDGATAARACTEGSQLAHEIGSFGSHLFPAQALWVQPARSHDLIGGTAIGIAQRIVLEAFFGINSLAPTFWIQGLRTCSNKVHGHLIYLKPLAYCYRFFSRDKADCWDF